MAIFFKVKKPAFQVGIFPCLVSRLGNLVMLQLLNILVEAAANKEATMGELFLKKSIINSNLNLSDRRNSLIKM